MPSIENSDHPLVSVIISSYNHSHYIEACIQSVLAQTYKNLELLVFDDGSTDDSVQKIQRLADEHNFFFQANQNKGLARTLNEGIALAKGAFIAPFGSDDIMVPERFEYQVPWLVSHPNVGLAGGNIIKIDQNGDLLPPKKQRHYPERFLNFDDLFLGKIEEPPTATFLIRREALEEIGGFNPDIKLEDLYIELKILNNGWQIGIMDKVLAYYRLHPTNNVKNLRMMHEAVLKTYSYFNTHPSYDAVCNQWINHQLLKAANRDKLFARECLQQLPIHAWNWKTIRAIFRLYFG